MNYFFSKYIIFIFIIKIQNYYQKYQNFYDYFPYLFYFSFFPTSFNLYLLIYLFLHVCLRLIFLPCVINYLLHFHRKYNYNARFREYIKINEVLTSESMKNNNSLFNCIILLLIIILLRLFTLFARYFVRAWLKIV